ncbi:MAG: divalent metal cation transporter [Actinobacteria bacterium]|nr:divalent metal cation transporter [Actinomycetota bacterium]
MSRAGSPTNVLEPTFSPPAERRSVLDRAHVGDIEGALGSVSAFDTGPRRSLRRRLATLLAILGPGLVVMLANNDAGGISVYAQAGQEHGAGLLWVLAALAPVLFINQEMVARLGTVSGAGHTRLIVERFGRRWGAFALGDLLALNALTIVTDFIGVTLALGFFGVTRYLAVPIAALLLVAVIACGSFRGWERTMLLLVAVGLAAIPLALIVHGAGGVSGAGGPSAAGGGSGSSIVLLVIAIAGTTIAPWQFFFQQSNVVDKRITPRWLAYERLDTLLGTVLVLVAAVAIMVTCAWAFDGTALHGSFVDAGAVARDLRATASPLAGTLFAIVLLNASLLGAGAVTLGGSYAVGDYFGFRHSLHRGWREARVFHATSAAFVALAAAVVLIPGAPLGLITTGVQALAGILLPSASAFLLLLCNDRDVLGPWVNPTWLNAIGTAVVGALVALSTILMVSTLFPAADVETIAAAAFALLALALATMAALRLRCPPRRAAPAATAAERAAWTTPRLDTLPPPRPSRSRSATLILLRAQLLLAAALLLARLVQVGLGG